MNQRYDELDSLRGLAALSVFFSHIYLMFHETFVTKLLFEFGPLRALIAGSEAVTLFFVLSGFVLSLPFYSNNREHNYGAYVVRRFCRIYIPYISAIFLALLASSLLYTGNIEGLTAWFHGNWSSEWNARALWDHVLLVGTFSSNLNNVVWSLVHEMRISLIFPLVMYVLLRSNVYQGIALAVGLSLISVGFRFFASAAFWGTEWYATLHYTAIFIVGALVAKHREGLRSAIIRVSFRWKTVWLLAGIGLYLYFHPSFVLNRLISDFHPYYGAVIDTWFTSLGAAVLILLSLSSLRISTFLNRKIVNYLGKISYSLYLAHITVLVSCVHLLHRLLPMWMICFIAIIGTFLLSSLMYHVVEQPSIKLGRRLSKPILRRVEGLSEARNKIYSR